MANNNKNNLRVGIDIGTSKVVCIIAENTSEGINVLGLGIQNSIFFAADWKLDEVPTTGS